MGLQVLGSDKILRLNDFSLLGMVQNHEATANTNPEEIFELGDTDKVDSSFELATQGSFELAAIGNTAGMLARMSVKRNASTQVFEGYRFSGAGNKNNYCFTEGDITEMQFDLVVFERPDQINFSRSFWYPRCFLTRMSGRYDANGNGSETYSWAGNFLMEVDSPYHDIVATPCTRTSGTVLAPTNTVIAAATHTLIYVYVDERRFRNATTSDATKFTFAGTAGSTTLTVSTTEGYTIPSNAISRAVFYKTSSPSSTFPTVQASDRGTSAFYIKGFQVNIYLAPDDPDAPLESEKLLRCQSVDYDIDLRSEELRQLSLNTAGSAIYCRAPTLPFQIGVNASVYESDFDWWTQIMTKTPGTDVYTDSRDFDPNTLKGDPANPLEMVIELYTKAGTLLQTTIFDDLVLETFSERTAVQGRGEITLSFRGTSFEICGENA